MSSKQMTVRFKQLNCTSATIFACLGWIIFNNEGFRFWFGLISAVLLLQRVSIFLARKFWMPMLLNDKRISSVNKAVLITGCDSGFGNALTKRLDRIGFHVFACCLYPDGEGAKDLLSSCSEKMKIIGMDVNDNKSVEAAKEFVKDNLKNLELWAIVNNAGIYNDTFVEINSVKQFEDSVNTNLLGVIRVTHNFLPFIRKSKGRIVNVSSAAGCFPTPTCSAYSVSKRGTIMFSDVLRIEMSKFGVHVISIEPFRFDTRAADVTVRMDYAVEQLSTASHEIKEAYNINDITAIYKRLDFLLSFATIKKLDKVINNMESAIMEEVPQYTYQPAAWYDKFMLWCITVVATPEARDLLLSTVIWGNVARKDKSATRHICEGKYD